MSVGEKLKAGPIWYPGYVAVFTHDFAANLARVTAPMLLLTGTQDLLVELNAAAKQLRPDLQEVMIEGGGNWLAWEQAEQFVAAVEAFLNAE